MTVYLHEYGKILHLSSVVADSLLYALGAFVAVQLFYYLFFFTRLAFYGKGANYGNTMPGVTVLVCAWNERENLTELIPLLDAQEYPEYEVILLDDRSDDGSEEYIREHINGWKNIRYIRINDQFDHVTPKKYALTVGMKQAKYPIALMTDADCRPASNHWITAMTSRVTEDKDIVLGFSPYFKQKGLLNWFIRCETFYAAVQYLSFTLAGMTYMGVGRNILYKRSVFFANKGFYTHKHVFGGDDDIFLNEVSTSSNTTISIEEDSFVYSVPKTNWKDWFRQKRRHISVSRYYKPRNKVLLGMLSASHIAIWFFGLLTLAWGLITKDMLLLQYLGIVFGVRWAIQCFLLIIINVKLDKTVEWFSFLLMDFALFVYYLVFGFLTMTSRKPRKSWN
ncbi:Glycosyltransferase, catalytic subunit of cellulose synthase and poly-beta-1,6-N-acetylglucosamine synthase [Dyadobacter soli]|uniref:Glycosyltransferase, catalytic subunit of cellulose synthase and poly-beta-1,6-N-acetylglucosamine synthase n=1 Tax=Dyadobacter soli TaxID=659014 RepID=A0A1G7ZED0_9BACT|nr:glycosyltransferase [Dyadobacter soli]SDH06965.1 Glycosyltransferase, catalytic subunit of cellulose synthase and poly-beta-1,6-N-acetylglucosamine synthase [Dyadobacter soli]